MSSSKKLSDPFEGHEVKWRLDRLTSDKSRGVALPYIDARAAMDRLDEVVGPERWCNAHRKLDEGTILCTISLKIGDEWVGKEDGAGPTDFESEKGGLSDAFKRAAVRWGIGRYLARVGSEWVDVVEKHGKHFIADHELDRLAALLELAAGGEEPTQKQENATADLPPAPKPAQRSAPRQAATKAPVRGKCTKDLLKEYGVFKASSDRAKELRLGTWDPLNEAVRSFGVERSEQVNLSDLKALWDRTRHFTPGPDPWANCQAEGRVDGAPREEEEPPF